MRVALFDRDTLQAVALIALLDHVLPKSPAAEPVRFEVEVSPDLILEPKLELRRVTIYMEGLNARYGYVAFPAGNKSGAIMRLALYDNVEGIDEVKPQFRPAAREALRRYFQMEE